MNIFFFFFTNVFVKSSILLASIEIWTIARMTVTCYVCFSQLVPCAIVAVIGHPGYQLHIFTRFLFVYLMAIEAVSVLPQLRLIQNAKVCYTNTSLDTLEICYVMSIP